MDKSLENSKLVMIGGGGHCKSVLDAALSSGKFSDIVITDYDIPAGSLIQGCKVVGNDDMLPKLYKDGYRNAFISVGSIKDTSVRREIYERVIELGFEFPTIIDSTAVIADRAVIGKGTFVGKSAVINSGCSIDEFAIINTGAIIEHNCSVGAFSHVSVGSVVCGGCEIGNDVFIGANATVIQGIKINSRSIIGAGSIVMADVPSNAVFTGIRGGGN